MTHAAVQKAWQMGRARSTTGAMLLLGLLGACMTTSSDLSNNKPTQDMLPTRAGEVTRRSSAEKEKMSRAIPARSNTDAVAVAPVVPVSVQASVPQASVPQASVPRVSVPQVSVPRVWSDGSGIRVGRARVEIDVTRGQSPVSTRATMTWVQRSVQMVTNYFGRFSVPLLTIEIDASGGGSVGFGQHFQGRYIEIRVGRACTTGDLEKDWVLVHEMLHTAFPRLARRHRWMREGLSTYLETVVRVEAGVIDAQEFWRRWLNNMPSGLPRGAERGLDHTRSWGSVYWGGALFWLLADLRLREATAGKQTLKHALRAILAAGGNGRVVWTTARVLEVGDRATSTTVLSALYREMAMNRTELDLDALWADLGVREDSNGAVVFDTSAKNAALRRSMTVGTHRLPKVVP